MRVYDASLSVEMHATKCKDDASERQHLRAGKVLEDTAGSGEMVYSRSSSCTNTRIGVQILEHHKSQAGVVAACKPGSRGRDCKLARQARNDC